MGYKSNLSIKGSITIGTMIKFDGAGDGQEHGDGTCKRALIRWIQKVKAEKLKTNENTMYNHSKLK